MNNSLSSFHSCLPMTTREYIRSPNCWPRFAMRRPWDQAMISPNNREFPHIWLGWKRNHGFIVHCFEDEASLGDFLVESAHTSEPEIEICIGGQSRELWPKELFVSEASAAQAVQYFLESGKKSPNLPWTGTGAFARKILWECNEDPEGAQQSPLAREHPAKTLVPHAPCILSTPTRYFPLAPRGATHVSKEFPHRHSRTSPA